MTKEFCEMLPTFYFIILHYNIAYSHYTGDIYSCTAHFLIHLNIDLQDKKKNRHWWPMTTSVMAYNHWQRNSVFMTVAWYCHMRLTLCDSLKLACTEEFLLKHAVTNIWCELSVIFSSLYLLVKDGWNEKPEVYLQFEILVLYWCTGNVKMCHLHT